MKKVSVQRPQKPAPQFDGVLPVDVWTCCACNLPDLSFEEMRRHLAEVHKVTDYTCERLPLACLDGADYYGWTSEVTIKQGGYKLIHETITPREIRKAEQGNGKL